MGAVIDTGVFIAIERKQINTETLSTLLVDAVAISAITASELLHGVHRARNEAIRSKRASFVESILSKIPILAFDILAARAHAQIQAQLAASGTTIGYADSLIASTALSRGLSVVSTDARSYPKIPGLDVVLVF